jgi:hypothetical protein
MMIKTLKILTYKKDQVYIKGQYPYEGMRTMKRPNQKMILTLIKMIEMMTKELTIEVMVRSMKKMKTAKKKTYFDIN